VKRFLDICPEEGTYDNNEIGYVLTDAVAWLLINAFCKSPTDNRLRKDSVIEYGTSPRFGWLTTEGKELKRFVSDKSVDQLLRILDGYEAMEDPIYQVEV
jgi:hypothetical protein